VGWVEVEASEYVRPVAPLARSASAAANGREPGHSGVLRERGNRIWSVPGGDAWR
jgi:hypothetical protein